MENSAATDETKTPTNESDIPSATPTYQRTCHGPNAMSRTYYTKLHTMNQATLKMDKFLKIYTYLK